MESEPCAAGVRVVFLLLCWVVSLTRRRSVKFRLQASTTGGHKDLVGLSSVCVLATVCVLVCVEV